jgi:hypothetical protein
MPFDSVYRVAELSALIMDLLALPSLLALSYTTKTNYAHAHGYIRSKLARCLAPYGLCLNDIIQYLIFTDCHIIGSIALKAVAPAVFPIAANNLDIVVDELNLLVISQWLKKNGYQREEYGHIANNFPHFNDCHSYALRIHGQEKVIKIHIVKTKYEAYEFIFRTSNTTGMNMITGNGLFTGYRNLLNQGLAVRSAVTRMGSISGPTTLTTQEINLQSEIDVANNLKAQSHGFTFSTPAPPLHIQGGICSCTLRSACPFTARNSNDSMCSFMRLFDDAGYEAIQSRQEKIPVTVRKVPLVTWRLPDAEGGTNGLVFDCRRVIDNVWIS